MPDYNEKAAKALDAMGPGAETEVLRGIGYALLALRETQEKMVLPWEPVGPQEEQVSGPLVGVPGNTMLTPVPDPPKVEHLMEMAEKETVRMAEALARGILDRQLASGEATVSWDGRSTSHGGRIAVARYILEHEGVAFTDLALMLGAEFGFTPHVANNILAHARNELAGLHAAPDEAEDTWEVEATTLLERCGWVQEDGSWRYTGPWGPGGDHADLDTREALLLIYDYGHAITAAPESGSFEELRAQVDAALYGMGVVVGGRRIPPERVRIFQSAPARGTLTS